LPKRRADRFIKWIGKVERRRNTILCAQCGSKERRLGAGRKPGEASLLCECGKFIKWIGASQLKAICATPQRNALAPQLNKDGGQL
jgi:hypothetical protein